MTLAALPLESMSYFAYGLLSTPIVELYTYVAGSQSLELREYAGTLLGCILCIALTLAPSLMAPVARRSDSTPAQRFYQATHPV